MFKHHAQELMKVAHDFYTNGDYVNAKLRLQQIISQYKNVLTSKALADAYTNLAECHFRLDDKKAFSDMSIEAIKLGSRNYYLYDKFLRFCFKQQKYEDALLYCQQGLRFNPHSKDLQLWFYVIKTQLLLEAGDINKAYILQKQASHKFPNQSLLNTNLNKLQKMVSFDLEGNVPSINPVDYFALNSEESLFLTAKECVAKAKAFSETKSHDIALAYYNRALEIAESNSKDALDALHGRASILFAAGYDVAASATIDKAHTVAQACVAAGECDVHEYQALQRKILQEQVFNHKLYGRYEEALAGLEKILANCKENECSDIELSRCDVLTRLGESAKAEQCLKAIKPDSPAYKAVQTILQNKEMMLRLVEIAETMKELASTCASSFFFGGLLSFMPNFLENAFRHSNLPGSQALQNGALAKGMNAVLTYLIVALVTDWLALGGKSAVELIALVILGCSYEQARILGNTTAMAIGVTKSLTPWGLTNMALGAIFGGFGSALGEWASNKISSYFFAPALPLPVPAPGGGLPPGPPPGPPPPPEQQLNIPELHLKLK